MRERVVQATTGLSRVYVGRSGQFDAKWCQGIEPLVVVDEGFYAAQPQYVQGRNVEVLPAGEATKSVKLVEALYQRFMAQHLDRSSLIIACGGGVVSDVVGFAAATYLRGVRFAVVATTLLSQVDASIGGKNGINFAGVKNVVGTIRQPEFCVCDTELLKSLSPATLREGFAEVIKHGVIASADLFRYLEQHVEALKTGDSEVLEHIVWESVNIKASVVERDELESGERRKLNFGHTVGHAFEAQLGLAHGVAVAAGMQIEARLSAERGLIAASDCDRISQLLARFDLGTVPSYQPQDLMHALTHDKKMLSGKIMLPLLEGIGSCRVEAVSLEEIRGVL